MEVSIIHKPYLIHLLRSWKIFITFSSDFAHLKSLFYGLLNLATEESF